MALALRQALHSALELMAAHAPTELLDSVLDAAPVGLKELREACAARGREQLRGLLLPGDRGRQGRVRGRGDMVSYSMRIVEIKYI